MQKHNQQAQQKQSDRHNHENTKKRRHTNKNTQKTQTNHKENTTNPHSHLLPARTKGECVVCCVCVFCAFLCLFAVGLCVFVCVFQVSSFSSFKFQEGVIQVHVSNLNAPLFPVLLANNSSVSLVLATQTDTSFVNRVPVWRHLHHGFGRTPLLQTAPAPCRTPYDAHVCLLFTRRPKLGNFSVSKEQ